MNIKTVTTTAGMNTVVFGNSPDIYYWVKNIGTTDITVGATDNAENHAIVKPDNAIRMTSYTNTVYVNGAGTVEIYETDTPECPFKAASKGGGSYELPIATTDILGGVMPDGTTITVDENGVISAVGGSDDWTNVGSVTVSTNRVTEFSIPNLSNYKFMMLSISIGQYSSVGSSTHITEAKNYTRIFILDDYKPSSNWVGLTYYIGNDYQTTSSSDTVYPYIGYMTIYKSSNKVSFVGRTSFGANIYMK